MAKSKSSHTADTLAAAAWLLVFLQIVIGIFLGTKYSATLTEAYISTTKLGPFAGFHYYASGATITLFAAALVSQLWTGGHRWHSRWLWWTTLAGFLLALGLQITGNLLPMSAHDVRTANVEVNIAAGAPLFGATLRELTMQGAEFSQRTLDNWYLLHRIILPVGLAVSFVGFFIMVAKRSARPSLLWALVPLTLVAIASMALGRPPDIAATPDELPFGGTKPMWYVAPLHILLLAAQKVNRDMGWVGALLIPSILVLLLALMPVLTRKADGPSAGVRASLVFSVLVFIALVVWTQPKIQNPFNELAGAEKIASGSFGEIDKALAKRGRSLFLAQRCLNCHKVAREGDATTGPNLGRVGSRYKDPQWYVELLKNPSNKDRDTMPAFDNLQTEELRALAEYLRSLR